MAIKNLFEVFVVEHNDVLTENGDTQPIVSRALFVIAKSPAQAHSKVVRTLGDKLLFVENIRFAGSNDDSVANVAGVVRLVN